MYIYSFPLCFVIGYWISFPGLYSQTLLFILYNIDSLPLLISDSHSFSLLHLRLLGNHRSVLCICESGVCVCVCVCTPHLYLFICWSALRLLLYNCNCDITITVKMLLLTLGSIYLFELVFLFFFLAIFQGVELLGHLI